MSRDRHRQREYAPAGTLDALDGWTIPSPERVREDETWTLRVWYKSNLAESDAAREVHGRVRNVDYPPNGGVRVTFVDRETDETYRLTHGETTVLRKATDSRAFRRISERWGGVLGIASGRGATLPAPPWNPAGYETRDLDDTDAV